MGDSFDSLEGRIARVRAMGGRAHLALQGGGGVLLTLADYYAYDGEFARTEHLNIYMGVKGAAMFRRLNDAQKLEAQLSPGRVGIAVPGTGGRGGGAGRLKLLGVGVPKSLLLDEDDEPLPGDAFEAIGSRLHDDPALGATLTALWRVAEVEGLDGAFVEAAIGVLVRRITAAGPSSGGLERPLDATRLKRVADYVEANLADALTVAEMAKLANMSRHHFSRSFAAATGFAPYAYVQRRRVERARGLLEGTEQPVAAIASHVGWSRATQLSSAFQRQFGITPLRWRSACRGKS